ncbi:hypothetical protein BDV26DRAFT_29812 [Aspergillus bertholletiae]|uniref:F-box domain-containing protein n=1 Tax=Aspergillus bertholletiae TaxID=1226010 RepID=A0A5N7BKE7_9EURO|nr:hypothetical protein BDV26DRAFT_29812 [Aspergillus bertholletiae]
MLSLLDLPLELLVQIVQETIPAGFEAAALSCKTLYTASAPSRAKYDTQRKRFRKFKFSRKLEENPGDAEESGSGECWDKITQEMGIRITTTRGLLEHIALDRSVAQYIQSIDLTGHVDDDDEEIEELEDVEIPENLKNLVLTSPFIQAAGGDPKDWIHGIKESTLYADVFLLTLLSEVREVALHPRWDELDDQLRPVVDLITHQANHPKEFPNSPLSKLSTVLPARDIGYEERSPLTPFVPFFTLNSVSEVWLCSCILKDDGYTGYAFEPFVECYSPNLTKLTLQSCIAGPDELSQLLSRIPNLEFFEFSHEVKWHGCGYCWNVAAFLDTVQNTCAKSLKELSVSSFMFREYQTPTLVDMTRFQKLTRLELDVEMLCGPPYDASMKDIEWGDEHEVVGTPAWPKLIDMLPASIETFNLYLNRVCDDQLECIFHLIEGLSDARATKLPRLSNLSLFVESVPAVALEALNAAKESGFSIMRIGTSTHLL